MVEGQAPRHTAFRLGKACAFALCLLAAPAAAQPPCAAWPQEPIPLPTVRDDDALRARWAALRIRELSALAHALEPQDPARARSVWQHAACLAPGDADLAHRGLEPVPAVAVHRPEVVRGDILRAGRDAWTSLSAPIGVTGAPPPISVAARAAVPRPPAAKPPAPPKPPAARASGPSTAAVDALVAETAAHVRAARFEAALASAERARHDVASLQREARAQRSAELEVWVATAELALGREDAARASLGRALDADPALRLDAATSPKVRRALEAVRAERAQ